MSVSLLPSTLLATLRGVVHALSTAPRALSVSESRGELGLLLKAFGLPARLAALQLAATLLMHSQDTPHAGTGAGSPPPSALGSKALEAWLSEEVAEVQRREPHRWPMLLAKVLEAAAPVTSAQQQQMQQTKGIEESMIARFGAVANLSLRHSLLLALQLHRSPLVRLQTAGLHFVSQQLSWALSPSATPDNKAWWTLPDDLLLELSQLVASPAFPLESKQGANPQELRQQLLHTLSKLQGQHREAKQREEAAELQASMSAHANGTSAVADVLQDLGYSISSSIESLKDTLHPFPKLTEQDVASIIVMILRTQYAKLHQEGNDDASSAAAPSPATGGKGGKKDGRKQAVSSLSAVSSAASGAAEGWQITNVIDAIKELSSSHSSDGSRNSALNWKSILENEIDHPRLFIADERSWNLYVDIYRYATKGEFYRQGSQQVAKVQHLPSLDFLLRDWKHTAGHLSMLRWALPSALTVFSYLPPSAQSNASAARNARSILAAANAGGAGSDASATSGEEQDDGSMTVYSSGSQQAQQSYQQSTQYQSWMSFDLLESLLESVPAAPSSSPAGTSPPPSSVAQSLYASLRSLLSLALERCPDLLLTGLLSVRPKGKLNLVKDELFSCMLPVHLAIAPHPAVAAAFQKLWETAASASEKGSANAKTAVFWVMRYMMQNTAQTENSANAAASNALPSLLPPLLISLGHSMRAFLEKLLSGSSTPFTMDLQVLLPTGVQPFQVWFHTRLGELPSNALKEQLIVSLLAFVKDNLADPQSRGAVVPDGGLLPCRLSVESVAILFKTLLTLQHAPMQLINEVQSFYSQVAPHFQPLHSQHMQQIVGTTIALNTQLGGQQLQRHTGLAPPQHSSQHITAMGGVGAASNIGNTNTGMNQLVDTSISAGAGGGQVGGAAGGGAGAAVGGEANAEIEEEANSYFQKIYSGSMSLDAVIEMLLRYRNSSSQRERDVCLCMIHNLFDEYKFFAKYPLRELQITGLLFGALIAQKLVANFTLGIALRFVLEALRKPADSKMFNFGMVAIQQFKQRIHHWPQYATLILHIPHIQTAQPELANFLQQVIINAENAGASVPPGEQLDFSAGTSAFGTGFNADAQSFSTFASLTEAERHADMQQASAARSALDRAAAAANISADSHLPPGLGLAKPSVTPSPALAASLVLGGGAAPVSNPAGAIGGARPAPGAATAAGASASSFGSTLNIDSLLSAEGDAPLPLAPSENLKDKIHFIINCLSFGSSGTKSNLRQKGRELKMILRPEYLPYFSRYLVIKRVSIEANFQRLYAAFLDYVGVPDLRKVMLETTYYNIQVLLRNDKIVSSSSERSLLKNLGSWLGLLTIAKNKPIRAKYLDVKTLILDAYDSGRLIAVIPFAAKVLESCAESRVFKPPNPWLMGVVGLLREIFDLPGLKLNLKFEIEVLFNHLVLNMKEIKSTTLLQHRKMHAGNSREKAQAQEQRRVAQQSMGAPGTAPFNPLLPTPNSLAPKSGVPPLKSGSATSGPARSPSPNMNEEEARANAGGMGLPGSSGAFGAPAGAAAVPLQLQTGATGVSADSLLLPNLSAYVVVSASIVLFQMYPALKRLVPTAIDRAIREIINPVVERSLAIACVTSRELVLKDYCLTPDHEALVFGRGWVPLPEVRSGVDRVWSLLELGSERSGWSLVTDVVAQPAGPKLFAISSPNLHLLATANHTHWVREDGGSVEDKRMGVWAKETTTELGAVRYFPQGAPDVSRPAFAWPALSFLPADINTSPEKQQAWCALLGYFAAEGSLQMNGETGAYNESLKSVHLAEASAEARAWCEEQLATLGWLQASASGEPCFQRYSGGFVARCPALYDYLWPMVDSARSTSVATPMPVRLAVLDQRLSCDRAALRDGEEFYREVDSSAYEQGNELVAIRWRDAADQKYAPSFRTPRHEALMAWRHARFERIQFPEVPSASGEEEQQTEYAGIDMTVRELVELKTILRMRLKVPEADLPPWLDARALRWLAYSWRFMLSVHQAQALLWGHSIAAGLSCAKSTALMTGTSSVPLRDDLFAVAALAGWQCSLGVQSEAGKSSQVISWSLSFNERFGAEPSAHYAEVREEDRTAVEPTEDQRVAWCLQVSAGNFLTRRNHLGSPMHVTFTGNCMEPDENKMRAASNSMVANLTSSLALVTCKEPLRVSITNHLNQLLEQHANPSERALVERACLQVAGDNLELGTTLIEKAAAERAIREIDEQLAPVYQMRIKHRQTTGQGYVDMSFFQPGNRYPAALPEALRAKPGVGLSPSQLRVYEDFSRIRSQHAAAAAAAPQTGSERPVMKDATGAPSAGTQGLPGGPTALLRPEDAADKKAASAFAAPPSAAGGAGTGLARAPGGVQQQLGAGPGGIAAPGSNLPGAPGSAPSTRSPPLGASSLPSNLTAQQTLDKLLGYLATLEQAVLRFPNHKSIPLHSLTTAVAAAGQTSGGSDQEINVLMRLMAALLTQTSRDESSYPKDLVPLTFALKVFKRLYERENRSSLLQIDVHIGCLKCIRAVCPKLLPELTAWLLYADDDRKFILPITAGLLRARLLNTAELDVFLSKLSLQIFNSGQAVATTTTPNPAAPAGTTQTQQMLHPQFEFILTLVRRVVVKRPIVSVGELATLLETLNKVGQQAQQQRTKLLADHIAHLLEDVRTAALLAEKERSEQERAARAGAEGIDASKQLGVDPSLLASGSGGAPALPLSLLDSDGPDALDRVLEAEEPEPAGLRQQTMYLLDDWMNICLQQGAASDKAYSAYLGMLQQQRLLATPDSTQKFFRVIIQLAVEAALSSLANAPPPADSASGAAQPATMSYTALDALAKLFVFLLKFLEQPAGGVGPNGQPLQVPSSTANKLLLLRSFLSAAVYVLRKDQAHKSAALAQAIQNGQPPPTATFNQRPYLRLFTNLLHDLNTPDPLLDSNNAEVLALLATHLRFLRPQRCPAFLLAWLELIAHRMFLPKLLLSKQTGCSVLLARLLVDLFRFLQPYLRQAELSGALRLAYKGTLRLLLVLLHDFPEFLCEFHSSFCDVIPPSCIQMRNLILSAFPRSMRLPDPFTPNLKVDLLPDMGVSPEEHCGRARGTWLTEMQQAPRINNDAALLLQQPMHRHTLLLPLEHYLKHREPASFFTQLLDSLTLRSAVLHTPHPGNPSGAQLEQLHAQAVKRAGTTYNVPLINALVMYTGLAGIQNLLQSAGKTNGGLVSSFADSAAMDVYEAMLAGLDAEGRYYVLNAIANQLRFPNNHTHYFSCVLLYLFLQCKDASAPHKGDEVLMEQMTRVLLERLIVHRPHPWGLLITFIELIKNPRYSFWLQPFTRCAPEIERLFESVARSCMPAKQGAVSGPGAQGAVGTQPGTQGAALGSSVGAGNAAAAHQMLLNSSVPASPSPRIHDANSA